MDGIKYFQECCTQYKIECDILFQLGAQNPQDADSLKYICSPYTRKDTQLFAVCYYQKENIYIAWNLREPKAKTKSVFSVRRCELAFMDQHQILEVRKPIEYSGWNEETVYLFTPELVPTFIELHCGGKLCI